MSVLWLVILLGLEHKQQRFGRTYCLHPQTSGPTLCFSELFENAYLSVQTGEIAENIFMTRVSNSGIIIVLLGSEFPETEFQQHHDTSHLVACCFLADRFSLSHMGQGTNVSKPINVMCCT
jgi:hypothetical protein